MHRHNLDTVPALLAARAADRPDDPAIRVVGRDPLTYGAWANLANSTAHALIAQGVVPGDRVVVVGDTGSLDSFAVAWAAILSIGAVAVPVPRAEGATAVERARTATRAVLVIGADDAPALAAVAPMPVEHVDVVVDADDTAEIVFTSATTGDPKGVLLTHRILLHGTANRSASTPARSTLHMFSPGTTGGQALLVQTLGPAPHTACTLPTFDVAAVLEAVETLRPTGLFLVPAHIHALVESDLLTGYDLSSLRLVRTGTAAIPDHVLRRLAEAIPSARISNLFTTSELRVGFITGTLDPARPGALGRPLPGTEVRIVHPDTGRQCETGASGRLHVRVVGLPQPRYLGDPPASSSVFLPDGWVATGDIAHLDADGYVYLDDRAADVINVGGRSIGTIPIDALAAAFPGVLEAATVGAQHPTLGEIVVTVVRAQPDLDRIALMQHLVDRLGSDTAPRRIAVVDDFPRNTLGKILKRELRTTIAADLHEQGVVPLAGPIEQRLAALWAEVLLLDAQALTADAEFFSLGGNSGGLSALHVAVRREFGRDVDLLALREARTLREQAERIHEAPPLPAGGDPDAIPRVTPRTTEEDSA